MVSVDELELAFLTQYSLPAIDAAVGNVSVVADVPVNTNILSDAPAVVAPEKVVIGTENDPLTSSVELGEVVPTPTCAFNELAETASNTIIKKVFIDFTLDDKYVDTQNLILSFFTF